MQRFRNQKGFTLIELSIVLVIIGIILGAVIKGQDLIDNARAKSLASTVNTWSTLTWGFMDRLGRFPGDGGGAAPVRNGIIGNIASEQAAVATAIGELAANGAMANAPANPVIIGGYQFWVYLGNDTTVNGVASPKNAILICKNATCTAAVFTSDELKLIQALDSAIDGVADSGTGQFRGVTAAVAILGAGTVNGRTTGTFNANVAAADETPAGVATAWAITQSKAIWMFDRPY